MEQDPSLDARLDRYDLSQYRPLLQQAGIRTIESLLGLPDDRLKTIGLDDSAIERVRKAHNKHANATCTPPGTATGEHKCNSPWVIPDWKCAAGFKTHHIFISYRVASESEAATELHSTLSVVKNEDDQDCQCLSLPVLKYAGGRLIHTYLDKRCLIDGKSWEQGFRNGLVNSQVIVLLLSENGLQRTKEAHKKPDNQFLEIELALMRLRESYGSKRPVTVLPILLWSRDANNPSHHWHYFPNLEDFPTEIHCHTASPSRTGEIDPPMTIRQIMDEILRIQAPSAVNGEALTRLAPQILQQVSRVEIASSEESQYDVRGRIFLAADEDSQLRALLDPIDFDQDKKALESLYVKGTRVWLFDQTIDWVNGDHKERVLWVKAIAGVGKSVAAAQIASILLGKDQLVTSLFLKYNDTRKNNPRILLTTIAYGLCRWYAPIGRRLLATTTKSQNPRPITKEDLDNMSIPELFKTTIEDPLIELGQYRPKGAIVVVVDGLDECHPRDEILSLLAWRLAQLKDEANIRLLLTSRPEVDLSEAFKGVPTKPIEPSSEENISDLKVYIKHRLSKHPSLSDTDRNQAVELLLRPPEGHGDTFEIADTIEFDDYIEDTEATAIDEINRANGVSGAAEVAGASKPSTDERSKTFVWINLLLNTLEYEARGKQLTLEMIQEVNALSVDLKGLYQKTFAKMYSQSCHPSDLLTVISAIATAQSILTPTMIAELLFADRSLDTALNIIHECIASLFLVLDPGSNGCTDDTEVKFNHKSVADYLRGKDTRGEPFHVPSEFHMTLAKGCLEVILSHEPVINICNIREFHDKAAEIEDKVAAKITPSLRYSVAHWTTHFTWCLEEAAKTSSPLRQVWTQYQSRRLIGPGFSGPVAGTHRTASDSSPINANAKPALLTRFMSSHVFFWLECGSLVRVIKPIVEQLATLRGVIAKAPPALVDETTKALVSDTYRFIREFADPIIKSAPQVYNSGYAFTPKETAIYQTYASQLEGSIPFLVTSGPSPNWNPRIMEMNAHTKVVNSIAISSNGRIILSGSSDESVMVWDAITGQLKQTLTGHSGVINSVAILPDNRTAVSGSSDNTIKIWDAIAGQMKLTLEGHTDAICSVACSHDGRLILSGSSDKTIKVWNTASGESMKVLIGHESAVLAAVFSPDGTRIVSGSDDKTVRIWEVATDRVIKKLEGHTQSVSSVAVSPDGAAIVSGSTDMTIMIWDASSGAVRHKLEAHTWNICSVAVSPDSSTIISGSWDKMIKVWDMSTGRLKRTLAGHTNSIEAVAFSADGQLIVSGSWDYTVQVWDSTIDAKTTESANDSKQGITHTAISVDGGVIVSGSSDRTITVWDALTGQPRFVFENQPEELGAIAVSREGRVMAAGFGDHTIQVYDIASGRPKHILDDHTGAIHALAISPDSLLVVSGADDKTIKLWSAGTGDLLQTLTGHKNVIRGLSFSPDGRRLFSSGYYDENLVWILKNEQFVKSDRTAQSQAPATAKKSEPEPWRLVGNAMAKQWVQCGSRSFKMPHALFAWDSRMPEAVDALRMWTPNAPQFPIVIHPLHTTGGASELIVGHFNAAAANSPVHARRAFDFYTKATRNGSTDGQYHLGLCYRRAIGTDLDLSQAVNHFSDAAVKEHAGAQYQLALCFEDGVGVSQNAAEAYKWMLKAARRGHVDAQFSVGKYHEAGLGTPLDPTAAVVWYRRAAERLHHEASFHLARCYERGSGIEADLEQALRWCKSAATADHDEAKALLFELSRRCSSSGNLLGTYLEGYCHERGIDTVADSDSAMRLYRDAADRYSAAAQKALFKLARVLAETQDPHGQRQLAACYEHGYGTERNTDRALALYLKAARQFDDEAQRGLFDLSTQLALDAQPTSQYYLAACHQHGFGTAADALLAARYYWKADEELHPFDDSDEPGDMDFALLEGTDADESQVVDASACQDQTELSREPLFQLASDLSNRGVAEARFYLGYCHLKGCGVDRDGARAVEEFEQAVEDGNVDAMLYLGHCYHQEQDVEQDHRQAFDLYKKAAEGLQMDAQYWVGRCYANGVGTARNDDLALQSYEIAVDGGNVPARDALHKLAEQLAADGNRNGQYYLARCFEFGIGTNRSIHSALEWYQKAASQDHAEAQYSLGVLLLEDVQQAEKDPTQALGWFKRAAEQGHPLAAAKLEQAKSACAIQ